MNSQTLLDILRLVFRLAEFVLRRRAAKPPATTTRADREGARVAPPAEKALDQVAPHPPLAALGGTGGGAATPAGQPAPAGPSRPKRSVSLTLARAAVVGAAAAGGVAYVVVRQQRRVRDRYQLLNAPFPEELLEVLARPAGGGRLSRTAEGLIDAASGMRYAIIDGIPDLSMSLVPREDRPAPDEGSWLKELYAPLGPWLLGRDRAGDAALAGAAASAAGNGWALSVPCGRGDYEIEMARANPRARIVCMDMRWDSLLEARRRALEAGLTNLYFARGSALWLPLQDASVHAVWTADAFHRYREPERAMTQIARIAKEGALIAGVSLVADGPRHLEVLLHLVERRLPGRREVLTHFALLAASGLRDLNAFRDGAYVRFIGWRA